MESIEIIFVLAILLLVFGPEKLPVLARELGEAIYEFRKASSGILSPSTAKNAKEINIYKSAVETIANRLNIETEGKTIKQITQEIETKIESMNEEK